MPGVPSWLCAGEAALGFALRRGPATPVPEPPVPEVCATWDTGDEAQEMPSPAEASLPTRLRKHLRAQRRRILYFRPVIK
jgi:hypothetical protein